MAAYYNEIDPKAAAWLRELIRRNLIAPGDVDERSIVDVRADDLRRYEQCHFFAGIGGWSYALRLAGWSDARPVWTGSCPCQPFSAAGKGEGYGDERHLWPHWYRLIGELRPSTIFGEQVDAAIRTGWLDDVCLSLESIGYAVGAVDFPACSVGAPHIRQRLYFVAESERGTAERHGLALGGEARGSEGDQRQRLWPDARDGGDARAVADAESQLDGSGPRMARRRAELADDGGNGVMGDANEQGSQGRGLRSGERAGERAVGEAGATSGMGDTESERQRTDESRRDSAQGEQLARSGSRRDDGDRGAVNGFWRDAIWLPCRDGKARPTQPGIEPLVDGAPARVVSVCAKCETETLIHEGLPFVRLSDSWKGRLSQEVLQCGMLSAASAISADPIEERRPLSSEEDGGSDVRALRGNGQSARSSQGSEPQERCSEQPRDALPYLPSQGAYARAAFDLRRLWERVQGGIAPQQTENLFCSVCARVGPHQCKQTMGASRVIELRGYGNAIVAEQARAFIEAASA